MKKRFKIGWKELICRICALAWIIFSVTGCIIHYVLYKCGQGPMNVLLFIIALVWIVNLVLWLREMYMEDNSFSFMFWSAIYIIGTGVYPFLWVK